MADKVISEEYEQLTQDDTRAMYKDWFQKWQYLNVEPGAEIPFTPVILTDDSIKEVIQILANIHTPNPDSQYSIKIHADNQDLLYLSPGNNVIEWQEWYTPDRPIDEELRDRLDKCIRYQLPDMGMMMRELSEIFRKDKELQEGTAPAIKRPRASGTEITDWFIGSTKDAKGILSVLMNSQEWIFNSDENHFEQKPEELNWKAILRNKTSPPPEVYDDPGLLALWLAPLKQIIDQFDNLTGVIHLLMQLHWLEHKQEDGMAWITPMDIINYRHVKTWKGKLLDKELIKISNAFCAVLEPEIEGQSQPVWIYNTAKKKREKIPLKMRGPVWVCSNTVYIPVLPGFKKEIIQAIHYQPGDWLKQCMAPYSEQLMRIAPILVSYDLNYQCKHFRIGITLDYYFKVNTHGSVRISMGALLEGANVEIKKRDWDHQGDFMRSIEDVFEQLQKDGVIQSFECTDKTQLPGWKPLKKWLNKIWIFTPPPEIGIPYLEVHEKEQKHIARGIKAKEAAQQKALEAAAKKKLSTS